MINAEYVHVYKVHCFLFLVELYVWFLVELYELTCFNFWNFFFDRSFPWIVEIFNLSPYHFYKVIEIIIRTEEGFSRDVVKHLNHVSYKRLFW